MDSADHEKELRRIAKIIEPNVAPLPLTPEESEAMLAKLKLSKRRERKSDGDSRSV